MTGKPPYADAIQFPSDFSNIPSEALGEWYSKTNGVLEWVNTVLGKIIVQYETAKKDAKRVRARVYSQVRAEQFRTATKNDERLPTDAKALVEVHTLVVAAENAVTEWYAKRVQIETAYENLVEKKATISREITLRLGLIEGGIREDNVKNYGRRWRDEQEETKDDEL